MHGTWTTTGGHVARGLTRQPVLALGGIGAAVIAWHVDPVGVLVAVGEVAAVVVGVPLAVIGIRRSIERRRLEQVLGKIRVYQLPPRKGFSSCAVCGIEATSVILRGRKSLHLCDTHRTPALERIRQMQIEGVTR